MIIIAYGSPIRGDDGIGWHIIDELTRRDLPSYVELLATHQLMPELAETLSHHDQVIFVDAAVGQPAGVVESIALVPELDKPSVSFHEISPSGLLALCDQLYGLPPSAVMLIIHGQNFETGETLSPPVARALPVAVETLLAHIERQV